MLDGVVERGRPAVFLVVLQHVLRFHAQSHNVECEVHPVIEALAGLAASAVDASALLLGHVRSVQGLSLEGVFG